MAHNVELLYERRYLLAVNTASDPLFYLFDYDEGASDSNIPFQHFHSFYQIYLLLDESAAHIIEGRRYELSRYDLVLLAPSRPHTLMYPSGTPQRRLLIKFSIPAPPGMQHSALQELHSPFYRSMPVFRFSESDRQYLFEPLNAIFSAGKTLAKIRTFAVHGRFIEFLCRFYERSEYNLYVPPALPDSIERRVRAIASYIHSHFRDKLALDFLARKFSVGPYYLSHRFKQITGFTLTTYIQMTRVRNAKQLLLFTDKTITAIAEESGFGSFSQFNRVFNKFSGASPSAFRSQRRAAPSSVG